MVIRGEVEGADFGDNRLSRRHVRLAELLAKNPAQSFPKATGSDAELEATYRFLRNEAVTPDRILSPHYGATLQRCASTNVVLIAHDSTDIGFGTQREERRLRRWFWFTNPVRRRGRSLSTGA